jgi:NAD(P)H-quinone oxidoreductase subunit 5
LTCATTTILGTTIALAQRDIKKGLAYFTMFQLGYMMLALGIGSYKADLVHLMTHTYSKALLFFGFKSIIHSMEPIVGYSFSKSQNMAFYGWFEKRYANHRDNFFIVKLCLYGISPLACFWSKDENLVDSWLYFLVIGWIA